MPVLGLGVYSICGDKLKRTLKSALDMGIRLIDTASFIKMKLKLVNLLDKLLEMV